MSELRLKETSRWLLDPCKGFIPGCLINTSGFFVPEHLEDVKRSNDRGEDRLRTAQQWCLQRAAFGEAHTTVHGMSLPPETALEANNILPYSLFTITLPQGLVLQPMELP